jgi:photosystem II stability/assembly factor-like uncharacterized protein
LTAIHADTPAHEPISAGKNSPSHFSYNRRMKKLLTLSFIVFAAALSAQQSAPSSSPVADALNTVQMRNIGPFRSSAWITAIAVPDAPVKEHLYTIYAASRSGGLWKTSNNGITWDAISDSVNAAAVGAVAVAPSNSQIVWMGTGANDIARSSYSGIGVFKSTDAGKTWSAPMLPDSHHIGRIVIHPTNPDIVYVAAIGHLFSKNAERGVFKTIDGGKTWKKTLFINDGVGAVDLVINKKTPATLYAAMYDKERFPWQIIESGPESGLFRSDDGGEKWTKLTGGLPTGKIGRIGVDIYQKNPLILYALLENQNPRGGAATPGTSATSPLAQGIIGNELYRTDDGGRTWRNVSPGTNVAGGKAPYSFNQLKINPHNDQHVIVTSDSMFQTKDGGKTWTSDFFRGVFGDFRAMWWDDQDEDRVMLGSDGGVNVSYDRGRTSDYFPNLAIGEAYAIGIDMDDPYHVYAGFQDHDSWKGPVNSRMGEISLEDWVTVGPGDGMYNVVDPTDSRWVYNTRELNSLGRLDQKTGIRTMITPGRAGTGTPPLRYNWIAPIAMSPHNPQIIYTGAQRLFRSLNRGDNWEEISGDLTTDDATKLRKNVPFCTITSISESPLTAGVIWVGTDDGKVQLTRNHGGAWTDLTPALVSAGAPVDRWVSRVFASPHNAGTAFVSKNGFRNDDFRPFLYKTTDFGKTWTPIVGDLPGSPINVVVQDRKNADLLYIGNDRGVWVSLNSGTNWTRLRANLPTVAVHDLTIHPRENDLVLGTYGRALWSGDVSFVPELTAENLAKNAHLFDIEAKARYGFGTQGSNFSMYGNKYLTVPNEPEAIVINYYVKADQAAGAKITVTDLSGRVMRQLDGPAKKGLNRVLWPLAGGRGGGPGGGAPGGRGGAAPAPPAGVGDYNVTVEVAGEKLTKPAKIRERIQ